MDKSISRLTIENISIDVERKNIRSIRLAIYPQTGRVRLSAPRWVSEESLRMYAASRLPWIKKHRNKIANRSPRPTYEYVSGEYHFYNGDRYLLEVIPSGGRRGVLLEDSTMKLFAEQEATKHERGVILAEWYRDQLKVQLPSLISLWEERMGVRVREWGIKRMKTRWGSCNVRAQRIWLNLELAKRSHRCLEYVLVHEMAHLLEPNHSKRFAALMTRFLPGWKFLKEELKNEQ